MKAFSLNEPYASAIAYGHKTIETRSRLLSSKVEGERIAIHASKRRDHEAIIDLADKIDFPITPGYVVATAEVTWICLLYTSPSPRDS